MMYSDGLWLSGMNITIDRKDCPIPEAMRKQPISIRLTPMQMTAVAAVLGLGLKDGELLTYQDDDLVKMMSEPDNDTIKREFCALKDGSPKSKRRSTRVFTPAVNVPDVKTAWENDETLKRNSYLSIEDAKDIDD